MKKDDMKKNIGEPEQERSSEDSAPDALYSTLSPAATASAVSEAAADTDESVRTFIAVLPKTSATCTRRWKQFACGWQKMNGGCRKGKSEKEELLFVIIQA
jgi:hypothetical protein